MDKIYLVVEVKGKTRENMCFCYSESEARDCVKSLKEANAICKRRGYAYEVEEVENW